MSATSASAAVAGSPEAWVGQNHVILETTCGTLTVELYWQHAPRTCYNFRELARSGYYDGVPFHRLVKDFMIQGGDPSGTGRGGDSIYGKPFADEITPALRHTGAGILSMANTGPGTNRSQFFITLGPAPWLDGRHTIFGRILSGMDTVQRLGATPTNNESPATKLMIIRAYLPSKVDAIPQVAPVEIK